MKLPNADRAVIAPEKLRDYLLNPAHRRGGSEAQLLDSMGHCSSEWGRPEADIRAHDLSCDLRETTTNPYGLQFVIVAPITGPHGRTVLFRSVWQIDSGTSVPRFIAMYPEPH